MSYVSPFYLGPDYLRQAGALKLARTIEAFWKERGFPDVECRTEGVGHVFSVRSNLDSRGLPAGAGWKDLRRIVQVSA